MLHPEGALSSIHSHTDARHLIAVFLAIVCILAPVSAYASDTTPSHVYQLTEDINRELLALNQANLTESGIDSGVLPELIPEQPRHAYQLTRILFLKIQKLRILNGFEETELPVPPVRDIVPNDVYHLAEACLDSLRSLHKPFDITAPPPPAAFVDGKTPTDVYHNLQRASFAIDRLGIPKISPNDVLRFALTINADLELILSAEGISGSFAPAEKAANKLPRDVYKKASAVILLTRKLTEADKSLRPKGDAVVPSDYQGEVQPGHVQERLGFLLAEVMSIKVRKGIDAPTVFANEQAGATPSDVFDALTTAEAMILALHSQTGTGG